MGKLQEAKLPENPRSVCSRGVKKKSVQDIQERWSKRKRTKPTRYFHVSVAKKVFSHDGKEKVKKKPCTTQSIPSSDEQSESGGKEGKKKKSGRKKKWGHEKGKNKKLVEENFGEACCDDKKKLTDPRGPQELDDSDIARATELLGRKFGKLYAGLQHTGMGLYRHGMSMPRFFPSYSTKRFVQILNVGDHWICVSNVFGRTTHDVYVYDSLYSTVNKQTVVQVTALLRSEEEPDEIVFHVRNFNQQSRGSRICGFYAVAAAFACCLLEDPTCFIYDEELLQEDFEKHLRSDKVTIFAGIKTEGIDEQTFSFSKLHCLCQERSTTDMIQCMKCQNRYHRQCVAGRTPLMDDGNAAWSGPCCEVVQQEVVSM